MLNAAERAKPEERKLLLRKLDQHLKLLDQQHKQLLERYEQPKALPQSLL